MRFAMSLSIVTILSMSGIWSIGTVIAMIVPGLQTSTCGVDSVSMLALTFVCSGRQDHMWSIVRWPTHHDDPHTSVWVTHEPCRTTYVFALRITWYVFIRKPCVTAVMRAVMLTTMNVVWVLQSSCNIRNQMCVASETLELQWSEVHRYSVMESIVHHDELRWIPTIQWIQFSSLDTPMCWSMPTRQCATSPHLFGSSVLRGGKPGRKVALRDKDSLKNICCSLYPIEREKKG